VRGRGRHRREKECAVAREGEGIVVVAKEELVQQVECVESVDRAWREEQKRKHMKFRSL
jgi:hypothetical protein